MAFDETLARRVRKHFDGRRDFVEKHMFGGVCFMIRGRMCCGIIDSSLMVRLDPDDADRLADQPHVRPMDFTGKPMRGYLFVEPEGIATPKELKQWVDRCVTHVETMPVKNPMPGRRLRALADAVASHEADFGPITAAEITAQERADGAAARVVRGAGGPAARRRHRHK